MSLFDNWPQADQPCATSLQKPKNQVNTLIAESFYRLAPWYKDFKQLSKNQVIELIRQVPHP